MISTLLGSSNVASALAGRVRVGAGLNGTSTFNSSIKGTTEFDSFINGLGSVTAGIKGQTSVASFIPADGVMFGTASIAILMQSVLSGVGDIQAVIDLKYGKIAFVSAEFGVLIATPTYSDTLYGGHSSSPDISYQSWEISKVGSIGSEILTTLSGD